MRDRTENRISELRSTTGHSQRKFADAFGIPVRSLQKWERHESEPPAYVCGMIERILRYEKQIVEYEKALSIRREEEETDEI